MQEALSGGCLTATDLADYLVGRGAPFRSAHRDAGRAVQLAESRGVELWQLTLEELREVCADADEDVFATLEPEGSVRSRSSFGGPAPERVEEQLRQGLEALEAAESWLGSLRPPPIYQAYREDRLLEEGLD